MKPIVPPAILQLWDQGHQVEAIKRLRQATGLGLKDAKDLLESVRPPEAAKPGRWISNDAQAAWLALLFGNPIEAIRRALAVAEAAQQKAQAATAPKLQATQAAELLGSDPKRAPGEVPAGLFSDLNGLLTLLALAGLAWLAWLLLH